MIATDFHQHSLLSDGVLLPAELLRRRVKDGMQAIAITDHVDSSTIDHVLNQLKHVKDDLDEDILFIPGVEITHVPPAKIPELAKKAKREGFLVVIHGETIVEPVPQGTNHVAVRCPDVDLLAHPGILDEKDAELAAENEVFVELSARKGHCLGNGRTFTLSKKYDFRMLVNSDGHRPGDYFTFEFAKQVALGAGADNNDLEKIFGEYPKKLLEKYGYRL